MQPTLERRGDGKVFLRDRSYRWLVVKRFEDTGATSDPSERLAALLAHTAYRDHFASPDSETSEPIHGPYRLDAITPGSFDLVSPADAEMRLRHWVDEFGPVGAGQVDGDLEGVFQVVRRGDSCYWLPDLGREAQHEWGWVVSHFHDVVVIGPANDITLVAIGAD